MSKSGRLSRREFARVGTTSVLGFGLGAVAPAAAAARTQQPGAATGAGQGSAAAPPGALRSEFLMDLVLQTQPSVSLGARTIVPVTGGTFEGPKLRGTVASPSADWPLTITQNLRVLDVRLLLVTDDEQRIYMTYRGLIHTPPAGQGPRYWRMVPIFETDAKKYAWLTEAVFVGVSFQVPQRVSYRVFQIL